MVLIFFGNTPKIVQIIFVTFLVTAAQLPNEMKTKIFVGYQLQQNPIQMYCGRNDCLLCFVSLNSIVGGWH